MKPSPNKFTLNTVIQHCKGIIESDSFNIDTVSENTILTMLKNAKISKAAGVGPQLFLIYVNDMSQAVKCDLFLYADDSCLFCHIKILTNLKIS